MGSNQKIVQNKIKQRIKLSAYILVPFILIGGLSIAYQLTSGGFQDFDFSIGKLWSWATNETEAKTTDVAEFDHIIVPRVNQNVVTPDVSTRDIETVQITPVNGQVRIHKPSNALARFMENREPFKAVQVEMIEPELTFNYLKSGRVIDMQQKEFLIPHDIKTRRSRIAVGGSFSPGISYRKLSYNNINAVARIEDKTAYTFGQSKEYRNNNDQAIMNFYSGFDVYAHINEKWSVQAGFYYSSHGEKLTVIKKNDPNEINSYPSNGSAFLTKQSVFESPEMVDYAANEEVPFSNYYGLMEIPILASYQCVDLSDMLHISVQVGGSYAYLDHADVLMYNYETNKYFWIPSSKFELLNQHFISGIAGVEISQYISHEIEVFANPQFKYSFTPTFKKAYEIKQNQWAAGLRMGMKVHL
ncbi:MAG: hypothetical protein ACI9JN_000648 [Bacteroidia bacterium]